MFAGGVRVLSAGYTLIAIVYIGGYISGAHFNPALSIGAWMRGLMTGGVCTMYVISQCIGATVGSAFARAALNRAIQCEYNGDGKVCVCVCSCVLLCSACRHELECLTALTLRHHNPHHQPPLVMSAW